MEKKIETTGKENGNYYSTWSCIGTMEKKMEANKDSSWEGGSVPDVLSSLFATVWSY